MWGPRRGDFLQGRDGVIPVKGLGCGWRGASEHFSFQVFCTHLPGWESGKGFPEGADASRRQEPGSTLWLFMQLPGGDTGVPEGALGLRNTPNKDFAHKFKNTFASSSLSPFQHHAFRGKVAPVEASPGPAQDHGCVSAPRSPSEGLLALLH